MPSYPCLLPCNIHGAKQPGHPLSQGSIQHNHRWFNPWRSRHQLSHRRVGRSAHERSARHRQCQQHIQRHGPWCFGGFVYRLHVRQQHQLHRSLQRHLHDQRLSDAQCCPSRRSSQLRAHRFGGECAGNTANDLAGAACGAELCRRPGWWPRLLAGAGSCWGRHSQSSRRSIHQQQRRSERCATATCCAI